MRNSHPENDDLDLNDLLHPARAFEHPMNVVNDPDLTLFGKAGHPRLVGVRCLCRRSGPRAPLPPWAGKTVEFDDVMDALRTLDRVGASERKPTPHYRRVLEHRRPGVFGRKQGFNPGDEGRSLN